VYVQACFESAYLAWGLVEEPAKKALPGQLTWLVAPDILTHGMSFIPMGKYDNSYILGKYFIYV
jgi:hypothetical protein